MGAAIIIIIPTVTTIVIHIIMFLVVSLLPGVIVLIIFLVVSGLRVGDPVVVIWFRCIEVAPCTQLAVNLSPILRHFS